MPKYSSLFSSESDIEIEQAGGFFCEACLIGKPINEQSPDPRYCQDCYTLLLNEARMDTNRRSADWKPKKLSKKPTPQAEKVDEKSAYVSQGIRTIMSPMEGKKNEVDIIEARDGIRTRARRGRKPQDLPQEWIMRLADEGMGSKAITSRLKEEYGIIVSYKTVQRVIKKARLI